MQSHKTEKQGSSAIAINYIATSMDPGHVGAVGMCNQQQQQLLVQQAVDSVGLDEEGSCSGAQAADMRRT
jgi:hypothetical protein